jgi:hypothetical protein
VIGVIFVPTPLIDTDDDDYAAAGAPTWVWSFVLIRRKFSSARDSLPGMLHSARHPPIDKRESFQFINNQRTNNYQFIQNKKEQLLELIAINLEKKQIKDCNQT